MRSRVISMVILLPAILLLAWPARLNAQLLYTNFGDGTNVITGCSDCSGTLVIPATIDGLPVTGIEYFALNCPNVTNIFLPGTITWPFPLGADTFSGCPNLLSIEVDPSNPDYSSLDGLLFNKDQTVLICCPLGRAGSYTVPDSVTNFGLAFDGCNLTSITIGAGVSSIGMNAFETCLNLTNVTLPPTITNVGSSCFYNCQRLASINMPPGWTHIADGTFYFCTNLSQLTIPNTVVDIGPGAFEYCGFIHVTIPGSVTNLADHAFSGCYYLESIIFSLGSLTNIAEFAFLGCDNLQSIIFNGSAPAAYGAFDSVYDYREPVVVYYIPRTAGWSPSFYGLPTMSWDPESQLAYIVSNDTVTIINYLGTNSAMSIPTTINGLPVTSMAYIAYDWLRSAGLTDITVPAAITNIPNYEFSDCPNLAALYFQGNAPTSGSSLFYNPLSVTVYYLPGTLGWGTNFGGVPTAPWWLPNPTILNTAAGFGVQSNGFAFTISWATNGSVVIEASPSLTTPVWAPVTTNALTNGSTVFSDALWTNYPTRFYRVRSP